MTRLLIEPARGTLLQLRPAPDGRMENAAAAEQDGPYHRFSQFCFCLEITNYNVKTDDKMHYVYFLEIV